MERQNYEPAEMELIQFEAEDVIVASPGDETEPLGELNSDF